MTTTLTETERKPHHYFGTLDDSEFWNRTRKGTWFIITN